MRGAYCAAEHLEERHIIKILLFLYENPGHHTKMEIYNEISTNPRMPDKLNHLVCLKLVECEELPAANKNVDVKCYQLTGRGRTAAHHLKCACNVVQEVII